MCQSHTTYEISCTGMGITIYTSVLEVNGCQEHSCLLQQGTVKGTPETILDPGPLTLYGSPAYRLVQLGAHCKHAPLAHWPMGTLQASVSPSKPAPTLSACVTPLPRPKASCLLPGPASHLLGNTYTHLGWGGHSQHHDETSVHCPISWHHCTSTLNTPDSQDSSLTKCKLPFWCIFPRVPALALTGLFCCLSVTDSNNKMCQVERTHNHQILLFSQDCLSDLHPSILISDFPTFP